MKYFKELNSDTDDEIELFKRAKALRQYWRVSHAQRAINLMLGDMTKDEMYAETMVFNDGTPVLKKHMTKEDLKFLGRA